MTNEELIVLVARQTGITKANVRTVVRTWLQTLADNVLLGEHVTLPGFGTFRHHVSPATIRRNPRTGEPVQSPAKTIMKFKAAKQTPKKPKA